MRYIPKSSEVLQALQDSIGKQIAEREEQKKKNRKRTMFLLL